MKGEGMKTKIGGKEIDQEEPLLDATNEKQEVVLYYYRGKYPTEDFKREKINNLLENFEFYEFIGPINESAELWQQRANKISCAFVAILLLGTSLFIYRCVTAAISAPMQWTVLPFLAFLGLLTIVPYCLVKRYNAEHIAQVENLIQKEQKKRCDERGLQWSLSPDGYVLKVEILNPKDRQSTQEDVA